VADTKRGIGHLNPILILEGEGKGKETYLNKQGGLKSRKKIDARGGSDRKNEHYRGKGSQEEKIQLTVED